MIIILMEREILLSANMLFRFCTTYDGQAEKKDPEDDQNLEFRLSLRAIDFSYKIDDQLKLKGTKFAFGNLIHHHQPSLLLD